jgi:hypothetical protein
MLENCEGVKYTLISTDEGTKNIKQMLVLHEKNNPLIEFRPSETRRDAENGIVTAISATIGTGATYAEIISKIPPAVIAVNVAAWAGLMVLLQRWQRKRAREEVIMNENKQYFRFRDIAGRKVKEKIVEITVPVLENEFAELNPDKLPFNGKGVFCEMSGPLNLKKFKEENPRLPVYSLGIIDTTAPSLIVAEKFEIRVRIGDREVLITVCDTAKVPNSLKCHVEEDGGQTNKEYIRGIVRTTPPTTETEVTPTQTRTGFRKVLNYLPGMRN